MSKRDTEHKSETGGPSERKSVPTVMQVLPALRSGGVERGTVDVARAIVAAGWNALVVSAGGPMVNELRRAGATHITLAVGSKNPLCWRASFRGLVALIRAHDVTLIHARSRMPAWIAWLAARKCGIPFVTTCHGRYPNSNFLKNFYNSVMVRGDRVIAVSRYTAADIARRFRVGPDRLRVIPRGVDLDFYDPDQVSGKRMVKLATDWRLPDGVPVVMLPSRVTRSKGYLLLIEALRLLADQPFQCLMVGPYAGKERYKETLDDAVAKAGLAGRVYFVGQCDDMAAAYKLADVVISASFEPEPFGRVIAEAQAMGRPVVASNHGGAAEILLDGETGWLVTPGDAAALAAGIKRALTISEEARARFSRSAIDHIREHFSCREMCAKTLAVYEELHASGTG